MSLPLPAERAALDQTAGPGQPPGPGQTPVPAPAEKGGGRNRTRLAIEWGAILVVAVVAAILIRSFVVQPFFIPSGSMEPTLAVGDRVLVNKMSYHLHGVHRGDIVVFTKPANDSTPGVKDLIKRVIGLPGETISSQNGHVYINGRQLAEPWLPKTETTAPFPTFMPGCGSVPSGTCLIPPGDYFMMGDNRGDSADSRIIGPVPRKLFIGRAFVRVWPLSRLGGL